MFTLSLQRSVLVVADSSVLIAFHQIGLLDILRVLYDRVVVPPAVAREVSPSVGRLPDWVTEIEPTTSHRLTLTLDDGEREALSLAVEILFDAVLTDDLAARRVGERLQMRVIGSVGILGESKKRGLIDVVTPLLNAMRANGLYISDRLVDEVLATAGEL